MCVHILMLLSLAFQGTICTQAKLSSLFTIVDMNHVLNSLLIISALANCFIKAKQSSLFLLYSVDDKELAHNLQTCMLCHFLDAAYTLWLILSSNSWCLYRGYFLNQLFILTREGRRVGQLKTEQYSAQSTYLANFNRSQYAEKELARGSHLLLPHLRQQSIQTNTCLPPPFPIPTRDRQLSPGQSPILPLNMYVQYGYYHPAAGQMLS